MLYRSKRKRDSAGKSFLDSQGLLLLALLLLACPLFDLATVAVRSLLVIAASNEAAREAGHAAVFSRLGSVKSQFDSAQIIADRMIEARLYGRSGIRIREIKTGISVKNADGSLTGPLYPPLKLAPVDVFHNTYFVTVDVLAEVDPLFSYPGLGNTPGLTSSYIINARGKSIFEHPQSLNAASETPPMLARPVPAPRVKP